MQTFSLLDTAKLRCLLRLCDKALTSHLSDIHNQGKDLLLVSPLPFIEACPCFSVNFLWLLSYIIFRSRKQSSMGQIGIFALSALFKLIWSRRKIFLFRLSIVLFQQHILHSRWKRMRFKELYGSKQILNDIFHSAVVYLKNITRWSYFRS